MAGAPFDLNFSLRCRRLVGLRFGVDQIDRAPRVGVFAALAPVVVFDSPIEIGCYACVQRIISATHNVNVPGGCRGISHCMDNNYRL